VDFAQVIPARSGDHFALKAPRAEIERDALEWATTRGARSGRTAWQYIQELAGRLGKTIDL
jgi:hypothetical protein